MSDPRPCSAVEAVQRALSLDSTGKPYELGTGDYRPRFLGSLIDLPWTTNAAGATGSDCAGFAISWCYRLQRHRPGFNVGPWSTAADDINVDSAIQDANHTRELFEIVTTPFPGALLLYPTITLPGHPGSWMGHVAIVVSVARCKAWDASNPDYSLLDVRQCMGGNGRVPGVVSSDGAIWANHDHTWPLPQHRSVMLRALP